MARDDRLSQGADREAGDGAVDVHPGDAGEEIGGIEVRPLIDDVAVPRSRIAAFLDGCDGIAAARRLTIGVVGHAGDGNMHPTICFDPTDPDLRERAFAAFDDILELGLGLGGTITGEHGVGRTKKAALPDQLGPDVMALSHRIKDALDPEGILNPGAVL